MIDIDTSRKILDVRRPMDHETLIKLLDIFVSRYDFLSVTVMGQSIMGRMLPMVTLGRGDAGHRVLYIGAHHGMEWLTCNLLLRFLNELCELYRSDGMAEGLRVRRLLETCCIHVLPMLNPDGVEYAIHGVGEDHVMYERLIGMNGGSRDFSCWQANARGVDLNHNYNAGFLEYKEREAELGIFCGAPGRYSGEAPESEPETAYLCNYLRFGRPMDVALTLHTQGEEIYGGSFPGDGTRLSAFLASATGYRVATPEGPAAYGGFTDWFTDYFDRPAFTLECGRGKNPLPIAQMPIIYMRLRRALFGLPMVL